MPVIDEPVPDRVNVFPPPKFIVSVNVIAPVELSYVPLPETVPDAILLRLPVPANVKP